MTTVILNRHDGGMVNDPRDPRTNVCRYCANFDTLTNPFKLTPYRSSEDGNTAQTTNLINAFCVALRTGTTYSLYGLGVDAGHPQIFYKNLTTGAANDLDDNVWNTTANNLTASGSTSYDCFVYYAKTNRIYGGHLAADIWSYDPDGGSAFVDAEVSISYATLAQGIVHSQDDIMYIPYGNKIASNNNGSWTAAALTLPSRFYITSICEHDSYIAIAAAPVDGIGGSRVFLWDRDSSLETVAANIDWGDGAIKILESINGRLIGISLSGSNSTRFKDRVIFREYNGYGAEQIAVIEGSSSTQLPIAKQKINNRVYFSMSITLDGSIKEGVWSFGPTSDGFSLAHERTPNNDTALVNGLLKGFFYVGDYLFQTFVNNTTATMTKTDDGTTYNITAVRQTTINEGMALSDRPLPKQLMSVGATYEALPTAGQVVLKYRVDGGSWTTVFTETTDAQVGTEPYTVIAAGTQFTAGREYEFRAESTGGAEITQLTYKYEVVQNNA